MWIIQREVDMTESCGEMDLSLYGKEEVAPVEVFAKFKFMVRRWPLDQIDHDWTAV